MLTHRCLGRRSSGFTLIELMVTLAVLALLIMLSVPSFATWMRSIQTRNAAESIVAGLQKAREEAVRRNTVVYFSLVSLTDPKVMDSSCALSSGGGSWVVSLESPSGNCDGDTESISGGVKDSSCSGSGGGSNWCKPYIIEKHASGDGGSGVSFSAKARDGATDANRVLFNGLGRAWVTSGSFTRPDGGTDAAAQCINVTTSSGDSSVRRLRVEVFDNGSVRMCDRDLSTTDTTDPRRCLASCS